MSVTDSPVAPYGMAVDELCSLMDSEGLSMALSLSRSRQRVDAVQDVLRKAVIDSSLHIFNGVPYYFSGKIYTAMGWDDFGNAIYDVMRRCGLPDGDYGRLEGMIKVCRRAVCGKRLKPDNAIVVFANCVLDMDTRTTHPFGKEWVQTTAMPYDYRERDYVFLWRDFLDEVLPDKGEQNVLQEFLGSIFIDRSKYKLESMLVLLGSGSNGKSVIFETVVGILGRGNVSNFGVSALTRGSERKKNIAFINGKRLNYCSEIQALEIGRDSDVLKALISGEPTEARPIYGENFTAYNIPLLMANANRMPMLADWSYGMRRRIMILPFTVEIPPARQDVRMASNLVHEYSGIFNWIMAGRDRLLANKCRFTDCDAVKGAMEDYECENSPILRFMKSKSYSPRYVDDNELVPRWIKAAVMYKQYVAWCIANEVHNVETLLTFGNVLTCAGYRKKRTGDGIVYGVYGKPALSRSEYLYAGGKEAAEKQRKIDANPHYIDGKPYAKSIVHLASLMKVSLSVVRGMYYDGILEGTYQRNGKSLLFDFDLASHKIADELKERAKK